MAEAITEYSVQCNSIFSMFLRAGLLFVVQLQHIDGIRQIEEPNFVNPANFWNYLQHGQDWVQGSCPSRIRQSPIDFAVDASPPTSKLSFFYKAAKLPFDIRNDGHAVSANVATKGMGGITFDNAHYDLIKISFHSLSEHTFHGVHKPLEMHLVHKHPTGDSLVIVAIPVESPTPITPKGFLQRSNRSVAVGKQTPLMEKIAQGPYKVPNPYAPMHNTNIQAFLRSALPNPDETVKAQVSDMNPMELNELMEGGTFMEYAGSLTYPPCSEIVTWFVRRESIKVSDEQILVFHDELYRISNSKGNYRTTMPLQNRPITIRQAVEERPEIPPPDPAIPIGPNPRLDNEKRAMEWAQNSLATAKAARDYVNDLDSRMQAAAIAHANALAPDLMPENVAKKGAFKTTTPPPPVLDMEKQAESMAKSIATAAKEAIFDAAQRISVEAKRAAAEAAKEASRMAKGGASSLPTIPGAPAGALPDHLNLR